MKKGIIFYITEGKEQVGDDLELQPLQKKLEADSLAVATSEAEISHRWYQMVTGGIQNVFCMIAVYREQENQLVPQGMPMRLCG
jgi:hypothetical protein